MPWLQPKNKKQNKTKTYLTHCKLLPKGTRKLNLKKKKIYGTDQFSEMDTVYYPTLTKNSSMGRKSTGLLKSLIAEVMGKNKAVVLQLFPMEYCFSNRFREKKLNNTFHGAFFLILL